MVILKNDEEIKRLRELGLIAANILKEAVDNIKEGVSAKDIDVMVGSLANKNKVRNAFKGYRGYPANICISVNDEVVHGIPEEKKVFKKGDIVSLDYGVEKDGYYTDLAISIIVGEGNEEDKKLVNVTRESLYRGIEKARLGNRLYDISYAIQRHVESNGFSVVRAFVGHGIGKSLHEEPQLPNFGNPGCGIKLKEGMVLAIEPMVNAGTYDIIIKEDGWTAVTADGKKSAHFEHCVAITKNGPVILTALEGFNA
ncbi:MAG: type I methionyl aminopeptidase [Proteobacteria bacterium]|nr:type I methionyl aminopeptidase [Pseudomonadota bacterium]